MNPEIPKPKTLIVTSWIFLLLASGLPRIVLQEVFKYQVSADLGALIAGSVVLTGFILTFLWGAIRGLRPFFTLFLVLVGVEWFVYTKVDLLPFYQSWLNNPSFNVFMLAEQSLRLMVTLVIIAALFILRKRASAFFLVMGNTSAPVEPVKWMGIKPGERWNTVGRNFALIISLGRLLFWFWRVVSRWISSSARCRSCLRFCWRQS